MTNLLLVLMVLLGTTSALRPMNHLKGATANSLPGDRLVFTRIIDSPVVNYICWGKNDGYMRISRYEVRDLLGGDETVIPTVDIGGLGRHFICFKFEKTNEHQVVRVHINIWGSTAEHNDDSEQKFADVDTALDEGAGIVEMVEPLEIITEATGGEGFLVLSRFEYPDEQ